MKKIGVIIPTYNYGKYIDKAIDSVLSQTYRDTEIIVVDDGSTDNTYEIIRRKYKQKIKYFYQENKGAPSARNFGLAAATAPYVFFLDADDYLLPDALSSRVEFLEHNSIYSWVYGPWFIENAQGIDISSTIHKQQLAFNKPQQGNILQFLLLGGILITTTVLLRTDFVRDLGGFNTTFPVYQDYGLWLRAAQASPIGYIEEKNVVVVRHEDSYGRLRDDNYATLLKILQQAQKKWPQMTAQIGYKWNCRLAAIMAHRACFLRSQGDFSEARHLLMRSISLHPFQVKNYINLLWIWFRKNIN